jgi:hypothetical protein
LRHLGGCCYCPYLEGQTIHKSWCSFGWSDSTNSIPSNRKSTMNAHPWFSFPLPPFFFVLFCRLLKSNSGSNFSLKSKSHLIGRE